VFRSIVGRLALVFFLVPLTRPLAAQAGTVRPPCEPRPCEIRPCQPVRCGVRDQVERTGREVKVVLEGRVLRYEVTERWTNHGASIGEADYVLPLPRGAAFEDLALEIDGEMVTGEALGAGDARRIYEEIVRRRRDPALVEWMELGVLRTRIFPIQPGETRTVVVRFRAVAEREGDALRVDVPAPRGNGTMASGTALSFRWPDGEEFGDTWSPTHRVESARDGTRRVARVSDATGTVTLLVPVRAGRAAAMSVLTHAPDRNDGYALITLTPPVRSGSALPRDVTFVLDVSGSMSGGKLEQARAAGRQLLQSLGRDDRFRLIAFAGDVNEFRDGWAPATPADRRAAQLWLDGLGAAGGTNIGGALERALEPRTVEGRLGLVLFLTDGAPTVGERRGERLAARAAELRGTRRVFTFGLGADVNAALLEQLALDGAGTAHFVRPEEDVERVVGVVAQRITRPVATDLRVRAEGVRLHAVQPAGRLDLFAGQELTILARYDGSSESGRVVVTGQTPDGPVTWSTVARFPARRSTDAFVGRLWATQRVGWLSAERRRNGASSELDAEIRTLGEKWGIPTELTSYLVLEPGMVANAPRDLSAQSTGGATGRNERPDASRRGQTGIAGAGTSAQPSAAPPPTAFDLAKAAAEMRSSRSLGDIAAERDDAQLRRTANRVFALRDSVWMDTRAEAAGARRVVVRPYSPAYFALIERVGELRDILAIGERVEVHGTRVTLVLAADGVARLAPTALADFARDW
jgi:Ca-activated chloride channel family protein